LPSKESYQFDIPLAIEYAAWTMLAVVTAQSASTVPRTSRTSPLSPRPLAFQGADILNAFKQLLRPSPMHAHDGIFGSTDPPKMS
jgi:hypothetical protein